MNRRPFSSFSPASVHGRTLVHELAPHNLSGALTAARAIPDGWYRCQALSTIAEHAPERDVLAYLDEAIKAACAGRDAYQVVAVSSWPLRVAVKRGRLSWAERQLKALLRLAPEIEPLPSRAFALQVLWGGVFQSEALREQVFAVALATCPPDRSWRAAALYRHIAEVLQHRFGAGKAVLDVMPAGPARDKVARRLSRISGS